MKVNNAFSPLTEKYVKAKVKLMSWSPKFDLLAVATLSGELLLYRLVSKERIWCLPVPDNGVEILSICWRPDGKVIAVSYNHAKHGVHSVYMEGPARLRKFSLNGGELPVTLMKWIKTQCPQIENALYGNHGLTSDDYLPSIPVWEFESKEKVKNHMYSMKDNHFHILLLCDASCCVTMMANGIFPIVRINCNDGSLLNQKLLGVHATATMDSLAVVLTKEIKTETISAWAEMYNTETLMQNVSLYKATADKVYKVLSLKGFLSDMLDDISEQCDTVAQEMDLHLTSFLVKSSSSEVIGDDFMQLLMWGKPTDSLSYMLSHHLTKREIKKLGQLVESSYTNIQQQFTVNFQNGLMNLYYHLTEIEGMVLDDNSVLPFCVKDAEELISVTGSLLLKTAELLQVIDSSIKNFKAFFRWLYLSMLKIQNEPVDKLGNISGNELIFVADFINEHLSLKRQTTDSKKARQFQLEKVYQYLKDEPLSWPSKSQNEWSSFAASCNVLSNCKVLIQAQPGMSLRQLFNDISNRLDEFVMLPKFSQVQAFPLVRSVQLFKTSVDSNSKLQFWTKQIHSNATGPSHCGNFLLVTDHHEEAKLFCLGLNRSNIHDVRALRVHFTQSEDDAVQSKLKINSFDFYDENSMTFVLSQEESQERCKNFLAQVDLSLALECLCKNGVAPEVLPFQMISYAFMNIPSKDISEFCTDVREFSSKTEFVSVVTSGSRKVSCVLSTDLHHIYPFLMDGCDEDDTNFEEEEGE